MHDIKWIRDNAQAFDGGLARRGMAPVTPALFALDARRREALAAAQAIQTERKTLSREIGQQKARGEDATALLDRVALSKQEQAAAEAGARAAEAELEAALAALPNLPADDVPEGADETANVEIRRWGAPRRLDFPAQEHFDLGPALGLMDFDRAAKVAGARFVVLSGPLARLERALASFMLDLHTQEFGYTEISPPALVRDEAVFGTGQLPKFGEDLFRTTDGRWLIPTAEVPLTNLVSGEILDEERLPLRFAAMTWCFRAEAGAAGKDTRGMIRQHQFTKVEMVSITGPEGSDAEHERMTGCAEAVLQRLDLPYRVVVLSTGDMGFSARKTYDIEVWLPGQGRYREISSCSNCGDFQARRMKARCRRRGEKATRFVHTLNGSGLAVGRTLIAIIENYQEADGSITVPVALRPYMNGLEAIRADVSPSA
ncbi:MAG: serine--tRNA ligase [Rhodospirillales bacterium]|nr:serine--tRNA ligase [Rhodospirillales bacterium]